MSAQKKKNDIPPVHFTNIVRMGTDNTEQAESPHSLLQNTRLRQNEMKLYESNRNWNLFSTIFHVTKENTRK